MSSGGAGVDPYRLSHSRLDSYCRCGKAFEAHYVKRLPREVQAGSALFGTVIHAALEKWSLNRRTRLPLLVANAWLDVSKGTSLLDFIREYAPIALETKEVLAEILERRPEISQPRRTKDFNQHPVSKKSFVLFRDWLPKLNEGSGYRFAISDSLPALYDESLLLAERYEKRMKHLPPSLVTEFAFEVQWQGFWLSGYVDSIEPLVDRDTGEVVGIAIVDYKTGQPRPLMKHYRQLAFYEIAVSTLIADGFLVLPDYCQGLVLYPGVDWVKWDSSCLERDGIEKREFFRFGHLDRKRVHEELRQYARGVEAEVFLPAHSRADAHFCDYGASCCLLSTSLAGGEAKVLTGVVV